MKTSVVCILGIGSRGMRRPDCPSGASPMLAAADSGRNSCSVPGVGADVAGLGSIGTGAVLVPGYILFAGGSSAL